MNAVAKSFAYSPAFSPTCPAGGGGGGDSRGYLAGLGITWIEILRPSATDKLISRESVVGVQDVRIGPARRPQDQRLIRLARSFFVAQPAVRRIESLTDTAHYSRHDREQWFAADLKVRTEPGSLPFEELGAHTDDFFVVIQPSRFADSCDLTAGIAALRMGTGLSVILLNEIELLECHREVFHG